MYSVLVIEDEHLVRTRFLSLLAGEEGFEVIAAVEDGESAIEVIDESQPDIILTDIILPKKGGVEVIEHIRTIYGYHPIIYAISDMGGAELKQRLKELDVSYYSYKSISDRAVLETLYWLVDDPALRPSYLSDSEYRDRVVSDVLHKMSVGPQYLYTAITAQAVALFLENRQSPIAMDDICIHIASVQGGVKPKAVEKWLRSCIKIIAAKRSDLYIELFGDRRRIDSYEFLQVVSEYLCNILD